jgi:hypothetical protein
MIQVRHSLCKSSFPIPKIIANRSRFYRLSQILSDSTDYHSYFPMRPDSANYHNSFPILQTIANPVTIQKKNIGDPS